MTSYVKHVCLMVVILASTITVARSEEPAWPKRDLWFESRLSEVHSTPARAPDEVAYEAALAIGPELALTNLNVLRRDETFPELLEMPAGQAMSEKQRELLKGTKQMVNQMGYAGPSTPVCPRGTCQALNLFAVSEDDARKMAEAFVELCDVKGRARLAETRKWLNDTRKLIPESEKRIADLGAKIKVAETELDELRRIVAYRNLDDVSQDVVDLDRALRALQVEMAGIDAKVNAIKKLPRDADSGAWIDRMLVTEDIERAGVLARKSTVEGQRKTAQRYYDVASRKRDDEAKKADLVKGLGLARASVPQLERMLASPPDFMKPLAVLDDKVVIHRIARPASSAASRPGTRPASQPATRAK